jgi:uncharacterized protein YbjT (DUF2867 family)
VADAAHAFTTRDRTDQMPVHSRAVFVTGGTGYIGGALLPLLLARGHHVRALTRAGSARRLPAGVDAVIGDALDGDSVVRAVRPGETIVHLVGTPHPNPSKTQEFLRVDLAAALASIRAAQESQSPHLIYLSVAQPAPMMHEYIAVRSAAERTIAGAKLTATCLRPWYVLGPGHRWPYLLTPMYAVASVVPSLRDGSRRLGLVTLRQMATALLHAVEQPPAAGSVRIVDVPAIRQAAAG